MLGRSSMSCSSMRKGRWKALSTRWAAIRLESSVRSSSSRANASPLMRAAVSPGRMHSAMRCPAMASRLSAAGWPRVSLTSLKSSRSSDTTATERSSRARSAIAWFNRSVNSAPLAKPVNGSRSDCSAIAASSRRFSHADTTCRAQTATTTIGTMTISSPVITRGGPMVPASSRGT